MTMIDEITPLRSEDTDLEDGNIPNMEFGGTKGTIGMLGTIAIMVNSLTGPAMVNLPSTFQVSGLIPTIISIVLLCVISNLCSMHMANVISKVPGNADFRKEIEYSESFRHFLGKRAFIVTQIFFFLCVLCLNVASIVDTAQVVDQIFAHTLSEGTAAFQYNINSSDGLRLVYWSQESCTKEQIINDNCIPFKGDGGKGVFWLTAGYFATCLIFLPMSLMDLKENTIFQIFGFIVLIILSLIFIGVFLIHGLDVSNVSLWGSDWSDLFGVVLFNFAVVIAIPAWLYEKKETIDVSSSINNSSMIAVILYIVVGVLGALTMPNVSENMLQSMISGTFGKTAEICAEAFAFFIIGLGIPLFSVLSRMNLTGSGLSKPVANLLAVALPWILGWGFYIGGSTSSLLGWGGILFTSIIVFIAPLILAISSLVGHNEEGSVTVYWGFFKSKSAQLTALAILLSFALISIGLAIAGELY